MCSSDLWGFSKLAAMQIEKIETVEAIESAYPLITELRPHFDKETFIAQVKRQQKVGYQLIGLKKETHWVALAGVRLSENLAWGRFLYVDDLVTKQSEQSKGCGQKIMAHIVGYAKQEGCEMVHLDSGVHRFGAHRFYIKQGMDIKSHHFSVDI